MPSQLAMTRQALGAATGGAMRLEAPLDLAGAQRRRSLPAPILAEGAAGAARGHGYDVLGEPGCGYGVGQYLGCGESRARSRLEEPP